MAMQRVTYAIIADEFADSLLQSDINLYRPEDMPPLFKVDECYSDNHDGDFMSLGNARRVKKIGHRSLEIHISAWNLVATKYPNADNMIAQSQITLYTAMSPNGHKVAIALEELGLPYRLVPLNMRAIEHKEPWFLAINPNGRIPALTDVLEDGTDIKLFESASILQYLVERYDTDHIISYPRGTKEHYQTNNWLFFQMGGVGPMQGQVNHFVRYLLSSEPEKYSKDRYSNETRRLWRVVDKHLAESGSRYIVGDKCTIADIALSPWAKILDFAGLNIDEWPNVKAWQERMMQREAVKKGLDIPTKVDLEKMASDPEVFKAYLANNTSWIRHGMEEDARL
ncbi:hypothetical protein PV10_04222 [Exophiala mesophila]|uniref:Glutathione S-transferase n=1 Tax=Exophiala mesophila TaxID=212818 RepID=A0A0D1ZE53_EXOME|nr:uncharacterized protein PV10_04222 [Exophiala mesophila]KIV92972.1 hypothetical protein PV10_04222 [Exophiala mesophila]